MIDWSLPLKVPFRISSPFNEVRWINGKRDRHIGTDFAAAPGVSPIGWNPEVFAVADGGINQVGFDKFNGNHVLIRHAEGYASICCHLSKIAPGLLTGAPVKRGDLLGYVGTTGMSTGNHLHLSITKGGSYIDPMGVLQPAEKETAT